MDSTELAVAAVAVVVATVTGAATGVGEGVGAAVAEMVRGRLQTSERGRVALERLDAAPGAVAVQEETQDVLSGEIHRDPELKRQLSVHLLQSSMHGSGNITISGGKLSGSQISMGPLTINKSTTSGRVVIGVLMALILVLVALGIYGASNLLGFEEAKSDGVVLDDAMVVKALISQKSAAEGWSIENPRLLEGESSRQYCASNTGSNCADLAALGRISMESAPEFDASSGMSMVAIGIIHVYSFVNPDSAKAVMDSAVLK
ncbi:hypothetical protein ACIQV3_02300 [Streptomyces sp. NPDC099050]|uniref:hypothetical protein n=1 Tax=Streptomyces sp. NPDC099050 TaxID=3366100 RepID=UPI0038162544